MADRYTVKDARAAFERLAKLLGAPSYGTGWKKGEDGEWHPVPNEWVLDTNFTYGGHRIESMMPTGSGIRVPLWDRRLNNREFCDAVYYIERAIAWKVYREAGDYD